MKLLTLNLNFDLDKHGPWPARRALAAEAVRLEDPDVVALQALKLGGVLDQLGELRAALPQYPHVAWADAPGAGGCRLGSALLSRLPLEERRARRLTRHDGIEDPFERVLLGARAGG